jgi:methionine synthase II (cobalamin-independent)
MNRDFSFSSIGIGSVSFTNPDEAVRYVLKNVDVPFWPQLPRRSLKEGMVVQFSEQMPCLKIRDKSLEFSEENSDVELERFYEYFLRQDYNAFTISADYAAGIYEFIKQIRGSLKRKEFVKGQITGPFTFASSINKDSGQSLLSDSVMMEVIVKALGMKALWQIKELKQVADSVVIFIDEPYLSCFGSAYTPINKETVINVFGELIDLIRKEENCLVGIHCCGNTDWGLLMDLDIDIINFDAYGYMDNFLLYSESIKNFISAGKYIAWGLVPTNEFNKSINEEDLFSKLDSAINLLTDKDVDKDKLIKQSFLSPACGLGSLDPVINEKIFLMLEKTKKIIQKKLKI